SSTPSVPYARRIVRSTPTDVWESMYRCTSSATFAAISRQRATFASSIGTRIMSAHLPQLSVEDEARARERDARRGHGGFGGAAAGACSLHVTSGSGAARDRLDLREPGPGRAACRAACLRRRSRGENRLDEISARERRVRIRERALPFVDPRAPGDDDHDRGD